MNERSFIMKPNQKDTIVQAALELFATNGYGNTSVQKIAQKAGVAQGLMYNFFPGKEALLKAILEEGFSKVRVSMAFYRTEKDPRKAIALHITSAFDQVVKEPAFWKLFHSIRMQDSVQQFLDTEYAAAKSFIIKTLASNFKKLHFPQPVLEAKWFFAAIDGLVHHYLLDPEDYSIPAMKKFLIQKYSL